MATTSTDLTVANEIKRQLGGRRFEMMTGARDFLGAENLLRFSLPRAKDGINKIEVRLDPSDTYTVTAWRVVRPTARNGFTYQAKEKAKVSDVYCDNLRDVFTDITGLATSL